MTAHTTMPRGQFDPSRFEPAGGHPQTEPRHDAQAGTPVREARPAVPTADRRNEAPAEVRPQSRRGVPAGAPAWDEQADAHAGPSTYEAEAPANDSQLDLAKYDAEPEEVTQEFTVRSSQKVHGGLAAGAALVAIGFAASGSTAPTGVLRWIVAAAFAAFAVICARALTVGDMLVADRVGIRLRIGDEWIGTRWDEIDEVTVLRRRHPLDDGRIAVHLLDPGPVLAAMPDATRRTTDANRRLTGTSLAVPFGLTARPSNGEVVQALHMLSDTRCPVREQL